jgi:hypothetical protein
MSRNEQLAMEAAVAFRAEHDLGSDGFGDLFTLIQATLGIDVMSVSAEESAHGLTMLDPSTGRIVIAVATTPHPMRQRSSVAHELGHVLLGHLELPEPPVPGQRSPQEIQADAFARHVLLPLESVRERIKPGAVGERELSSLVQEFGVSAHIAAIQLRDASLIDDDAVQSLKGLSAHALSLRHGWLDQHAALARSSESPRAPQRLIARAVRGVQEGVLGISELARWYDRGVEELELELGATGDESESIGDVPWGVDEPLFGDPRPGDDG